MKYIWWWKHLHVCTIEFHQFLERYFSSSSNWKPTQNFVVKEGSANSTFLHLFILLLIKSVVNLDCVRLCFECNSYINIMHCLYVFVLYVFNDPPKGTPQKLTNLPSYFCEADTVVSTVQTYFTSIWKHHSQVIHLKECNAVGSWSGSNGWGEVRTHNLAIMSPML